MILLDIETSGLKFNECGIWQIGAIDLNTKEEFLVDLNSKIVYTSIYDSNC